MKLNLFQIWSGGFLIFFNATFPALVLFGLWVFIQYLAHREKRKLSKSGIDQINVMSGKTCEK
ncbi:MAG: hypothetical protein ABSF90_30685 [Syntrophobacteraceae bacterium]|jgi:hypothetical protein